jgi:hypothetical protein
MEDGSHPSLALFTHPQWAQHGFIRGNYVADWVKLEQGDRLHLKGGFLQGSTSGNAIFVVSFCDTDARVVTWASIAHAYSGTQFEKMVDLSAWAGHKGYVMLRVYDTQTVTEADAATWTIARIERP